MFTTAAVLTIFQEKKKYTLRNFRGKNHQPQIIHTVDLKKGELPIPSPES